MALVGFARYSRSMEPNVVFGVAKTIRQYGRGIEAVYSTYQDDLDVGDFSQVTVFSNTYLGSASAMDLFTYWSHDGVNFYEKAILDINTSGSVTVKRQVFHITESARRAFSFAVEAKYLRVKWIGYGTTSDGYTGIEVQPLVIRPV